MSSPPQSTPLAPIAVFAYNRADLLSRMIESLRACDGFERSAVTIFVDGPRGERDTQAVGEVRDYVSSLGLANVEARFSEENKGLRQSIYQGVSEICDRHGRVIVLEDDLRLAPTALTFFNEGLDRYADEPSIWSVCGYIYDAPALRERREALILPFAHPWGWATWKRAWDRFDLDARPSDENLKSEAFRTAFDMNGLYPFTAQLRHSIAGRVNSWYIHWYYTVFSNGGRSIFPPRRVLDNFGLAQGTHGSSLNPHEKLVRRPALLSEPIHFPRDVQTDHAALDLFKATREAGVQRFIARAGGIKRRFLQPSK